MSKKDWLILGAVFCAVFFAYNFSRVATPFDSRWTIHAAMSLLREGNFDLDEYAAFIEKNGHYKIVEHNGHRYNYYPPGVTLLAVPFVFVIQFLTGPLAGIDLHEYLLNGTPGQIEKTIASFFVALTAALIFLLGYFGRSAQSVSAQTDDGRPQAGRLFDALALSLIFAFCTPAWSTASRALWQHGPAMLMLSAALLLVVRGSSRPSLVPYAGVPLALALSIRPMTLFFVGMLTIYVFMRYREQFIRFLAWAVPTGLIFVVLNLRMYGSVISGYSDEFHRAYTVDPWGLAGTLFSPSRGLFVWSPVLLTGLFGLALELRRGAADRLNLCLALGLLLHWVFFALSRSWWGGHSIGPRYFCEAVPPLLCMSLPALEYLRQATGARKIALGALGAALCAFSFFVNCHAANSPGAVEWNVRPDNIDDDPTRLWDWSDPQFLRGFTGEAQK